ncbi:MAG: FixH family protein [Rhodocyclaceae bacterium]|nr:FixH family protein [Rhodocyclaceae bacterium]
MEEPKDRRPWYREKLVWMLISLPAAAIVGGIATIVIATRTSDGLVADDYYKQGLAINQTIARDEMARQLGLVAQIELGADSVRARLESRVAAPLPDRLVLTLVHPTRSGEDQLVTLTRQGDMYAGEIHNPSAGRWQIRLEDERRNWRMNGAAQLPAETTIRIESEIPKS